MSSAGWYRPRYRYAMKDVGPSVDYATVGLHHGLVEVEAIQVECHRRHAQGREPDTDNWPQSEEEVQRAAVVEGCVLEQKATEVAVGSYDVVRLLDRSMNMKQAEGDVLETFAWLLSKSKTGHHDCKNKLSCHLACTELIHRPP